MVKPKVLFVDLNDAKLKSVGETITSDTSRKILSFLMEKEATESAIATGLGIPISTVHYHLLKLQQAGLVHVLEFHYSEKGREVNHYKLASQYIVIGPKREGILAKLKIAVSAVLTVGVVGFVAQWLMNRTNSAMNGVSQATPMMEDAASSAASSFVNEGVAQTSKMMVAELPAEMSASSPLFEPTFFTYLLLGAVLGVGVYLLISYVVSRVRK